jgi:arginyl-tRNA synthetase
MYALDRAKKQIIDALSAALPGTAVSASDLVKPPKPEMGDLAFGCFAAAKAMKKAPPAIAADVAAAIRPDGLIAAAEPAGPYVNFRFDRAAFSTAVLEDVLGRPSDYGDAPKTGEKVMIEYGQPNTHKELHVGHLRNICLGLAAVRMARAAGREVIPVSYIGDIGAHVAKCLWAFKKFHAGQAPPEDRGKFLGSVYAEATRMVDEDPTLKQEIAEVQRRLEARDPEWDALWRETRQWSIDEMEAVFSELGADFDRTYYESEVEAAGKELAKELLTKGIAKTGEGGALIMDLEPEGLGVFLLLKSDGSALYSTKELALARKKFEEFPDIARSVHVVDMRQSLYFRQFFATLRRIGFDKEMVHLGYEFVTLKEGAMSSRKGNIVAYEDFRDEMIGRVIEETKKRREDWDDDKVRRTARLVAEGAMKFGMLKQDNDQAIVFDMEAALSFDGFTGPYVQYAHARLSSILAKAGEGTVSVCRCTGDEHEYALLRLVADLPATALAAAAELRPSVLAQYLFDLAQATNAFYRDVPVLAAADADRVRRLAVVAAARGALARGLYLLGIAAPEEM